MNGGHFLMCDECGGGFEVEIERWADGVNYCPYCGADI